MIEVDETVEQARRGSREAFSTLIRRYQGAVRGYVARYVRDRETVNDIAQDTFLAAHRQLGSYRNDAPFLPWLLGISRRLVVNHLRVQMRRRRHEAGGGVVALVARWHADALDTQRDPRDLERELAALRSCVEHLPGTSAGVVAAFYFEHKSTAEIGALLGRTEKAVRMLLLRVRGALRDCVHRRISLEEAS
jgi:RNA polymerase sigma-70 factor (ECF subfamily)